MSPFLFNPEKIVRTKMLLFLLCVTTVKIATGFPTGNDGQINDKELEERSQFLKTQVTTLERDKLHLQTLARL
jgi:hypothetical protein